MRREFCFFVFSVCAVRENTAMPGCQISHEGIDLIDTIGTSSFDGAFFSFFADIIRIDHCTVFSFPTAGEARKLVCGASDNQRFRLASDLSAKYVAGKFRLDPNVSRLFEGGEASATVYCSDLEEAPNAFREEFFDQASLKHEMVILSNWGQCPLYVSFYRTVEQGFSPRAT